MKDLLKKIGTRLAMLPLAAVLAAPIYVHAQQNAAVISAKPIAVTPQMKLADIRALPAGTTVRLPNGHVMPAQHFAKLADAITKIQQGSAAAKANPQRAFSRTTAPAQLQLKPGVNLREVAKRPDSDVLQLPNGQKLTVGDLKKVAAVEKARTGRSLLEAPSVAALPSRAGPALRITSRDDFRKLDGKPDSTVLESSKGKRITLGELRAYAKVNGKPLGERK